MNIVTGKIFDEERALYRAQDLVVKDCRFDGPADGESAFKEGKEVTPEKVREIQRKKGLRDD